MPYTINSNTLYLTAYNEQGQVIGQRWHRLTPRRRAAAGIPIQGLGYNLGNALGAIKSKGHLLQNTINDLIGKPKGKK